MRRKSNANSRKWANPDLYSRYARENLWDEIVEFFPKSWPRDVLVPIGTQKFTVPFGIAGDQTHHISGGILGTPRWDLVTNLVRVSFHTHAFCERHTREGFALCAAAKIKKGEWRAHKIAEIMGVDSPLGWLQPERGFEFDWINDVIQPYLNRM